MINFKIKFLKKKSFTKKLSQFKGKRASSLKIFGNILYTTKTLKVLRNSSILKNRFSNHYCLTIIIPLLNFTFMKVLSFTLLLNKEYIQPQIKTTWILKLRRHIFSFWAISFIKKSSIVLISFISFSSCSILEKFQKRNRYTKV